MLFLETLMFVDIEPEDQLCVMLARGGAGANIPTTGLSVALASVSRTRKEI
jgi:hypothetical protein